MLAELKELNEKIEKLGAFIGTETFGNLDEHRSVLLVLQKNAMVQYASILACRCQAEGVDVADIFEI